MRLRLPFDFARSTPPDSRGTAADPRAATDTPRDRRVIEFNDIASQPLTRLVRARIVSLVSCLPCRYLTDDGEEGRNAEARRVIEQLTPATLGGLAADVRMMGNGALLRSRLPGGRLMGYQYKSGRSISAIIQATGDRTGYVLFGYRTRPTQTPPTFRTTTQYDEYLGAYLHNLGFNIVSGNTAAPYWLPEQVVHIKEGVDDRYDDLLGDCLLARAGGLLDYDAKQMDNTLSALEKLFNPAAIVKVTGMRNGKPVGGAKSEAQVIADEVERLQVAASRNHGGIIPVTRDLEVTELTAPAQRLRMEGLYNLPEFRFPALFGLPTATLGLQAGLENSPWSNLPTLRKLEHDQVTAPLAKLISEALTRAIRDDYGPDVGQVVLDAGAAPAAQEDANEQAARLTGLIEAGVLTPEQAAKELGYEYLAGATLSGEGEERSDD